MPLHAVVMAGGPGVRFWPWGTPHCPKHALPLLPGGRTLFGETVRRVRALAPPGRLWLVTTAPQVRTLRRLAPALLESRIIVEPEPRDTAAAVALASLRVLSADPDAVTVFCPADHLIAPAAAFAAQVRVAAAFAGRTHRLVTFGVGPDRPATVYGYLVPGPALGGGFRALRRFHEKPSAAAARRLMAAGALWNAGVFVWRARDILAALPRSLVRRLASGPPEQVYPKLPRISVDYAVMEKARNAAMTAARFRLTDLGTWTAWERILKPDARGNRRFGNARLVDCRDTTAVGADPRRVLRAEGMEGHLVVQAPAGLLVCRRNQAEDLKRLLSR